MRFYSISNLIYKIRKEVYVVKILLTLFKILSKISCR